MKKEKFSIEKLNNNLKFELEKLDNNFKNIRKENAELKIKIRENSSNSFTKETDEKIQQKIKDLEKINLKSLLNTFKSKPIIFSDENESLRENVKNLTIKKNQLEKEVEDLRKTIEKNIKKEKKLKDSNLNLKNLNLDLESKVIN